jgi:hypothetical protein
MESKIFNDELIIEVAAPFIIVVLGFSPCAALISRKL